MKSIEEADIKNNTKVLVRVDWNLPIGNNGEILDHSRIESSIKTIAFIKNKGGIPIIASHFGRDGDSIESIIQFAKTNFQILSEGVEFLENLRKDKGEEENKEDFARELAKKADIFVNEAFSVSHRKHASIVGVPKFLPSFVGFNFLEEFENLSLVFNPEHPFLVILGGAKFETKIPLAEKILDFADNVFIGGALHKVSENSFAYNKLQEIISNPKVLLPEGDLLAQDANTKTIAMLEEKIKESKTVLWNGPLGNYEKGFVAGTVALARIIAESDAKVVIGGGDTLASVNDRATKDKISSHGFISTAGGAMLDFLANGTLPGIEALK